MRRIFTIREILILGVWIGLLGGFAEVAMLGVARFGLHRAMQAGLNVIWAIPISLAVLVGLAALPVGLLARTRVGIRWPALPLVVLCFLAVTSLTLPFFQIHPAARLFLTATIALQVGIVLARNPDRLLSTARRTVVPLAGFVGLLALGIPGLAGLRERAMVPRLPIPKPGAPNVLLIVLDTERALDLSLYGYARRTTPTLERIGREGAVFERAYATSSWTLSSHASLFTGHLPLALGAGWLTPLAARNQTLAETFAERGYITGGFSANGFYVTRGSGLAQGFMHFEGRRVTPLSVLFRSALGARLASPDIRGRLLDSYQIPGRKTASHLGRNVLAWLEGVSAERPYFVFINYFDAHQPYLPPTPFDTAFTGRKVPASRRNPSMDFPRWVTPDDVILERTAYDQVIAAQDQQLGTLLSELRAAGHLRNTIIAVTSDHGEEFGEHGVLDHGNSLNPAVLWVPLILIDPQRRFRGLRIPEAVSLVDLPATLLALSDSSRSPELPGYSLVPLLNQSPNPVHSPVVSELPRGIGKPAWLPVSSGPLRSLIDGDWHYVRDAVGKETLMSLKTRPEGSRVNKRLPENRLQLRRMRALLDSASTRDRDGGNPLLEKAPA